MTIYLKQSTASQEVALGFFVDSTDGNTEETGLTIAAADIRLYKAGGTTLTTPAAGATHISNGIYYWVADATDTNTLGPLVIYCHPTGALAVRVECCVLAANVYDSLIGGGDLLQVDTTQVSGTAQTAGDIIGDTNDIQTRLPAALVSGRMDVSVGAMAANVVTAASIAASALDGKGNWNIGKTGYSLTAGTGLGNQTADITGTIGTVTTLTNLPTIPANWITAAGMDATASAEIADAVWDEAISGHLGAGSTGAALNAAGSAGDPWTTPLPGAYGAGTAGYIIGTNVDGLISDIPTAVENADALLGRNVSGGSSTGRTVKQAFHFIRNKWVVSGGVLTVYDTDDSTSSWTSSVTSSAGADPIVGNDPA